MASIDPTSAAVALVHDGSDRGAAGAPARDLTEADIARLAYRRARAASDDQVGRLIDPDDPDKGVIARPDPRTPDPAVVAEILDELQASGRYAPAEKPAKKAAKVTDTPPDPAAPADSTGGPA